MERILPIFITMFLGLSCELIVLPPIIDDSTIDDSLSTLLSNVRVQEKYSFPESALEIFTRSNKVIKDLNAVYPNITAQVEEGGQDPEKLIEKAFIDLKNTIARGSTELYNETFVLKFGSELYENVEEFKSVLFNATVDRKFKVLPIYLSFLLEDFPSAFQCHLEYDPSACPTKA